MPSRTSSNENWPTTSSSSSRNCRSCRLLISRRVRDVSVNTVRIPVLGTRKRVVADQHREPRKAVHGASPSPCFLVFASHFLGRGVLRLVQATPCELAEQASWLHSTKTFTI